MKTPNLQLTGTSAVLKKIVFATLLLVVFLNHAGYYLFSLIQQMELKREAREEIIHSLPLSELDCIVSNPDIRWEEKGKEFYYKGHMYDVAAIREEAGRTVIYCLKDSKETDWLKRMAQIHTESRHKDKKNNLHFFSFESTEPSLEKIKAIHGSLVKHAGNADAQVLQGCLNAVFSPPRC